MLYLETSFVYFIFQECRYLCKCLSSTNSAQNYDVKRFIAARRQHFLSICLPVNIDYSVKTLKNVRLFKV